MNKTTAFTFGTERIRSLIVLISKSWRGTVCFPCTEEDHCGLWSRRERKELSYTLQFKNLLAPKYSEWERATE